MRIRERLERLEADRQRKAPVRRRCSIDRLEGQTDEEAWRLSEYANLPFDDGCVILAEGYMREVHHEIWGEQTCNILGLLGDHYANEFVAKIRHEQEAVRGLMATGALARMKRSACRWSRDFVVFSATQKASD